MIIGIGIDSIEIHRFAHWHDYSKNRLKRIFSDEEIVYCLNNTQKSAERFAARFAAKEALYKAVSALGQQEPFLKIAKYIEVKHEDGRPALQLQRYCLVHNISKNGVHPECFCASKNVSKDQASNQPQIHLSLTHTKTTATAVVIIEKQ